MQQPKKKPTNITKDSLIEKIKNYSSSGGGKTNTFFNQFWSFYENEAFENLTPPEKIEKKELPKRGAYERRQEVILFSAREQQVYREIEAIRNELMAMVKVVKEVDFEIQKAVIEIPVKPGVYHLRFLEKIRQIIKLVRQKLEDSKTWLRLCSSRRKQRYYWALYKKKGTSFGLSSERVVATQTG